MSKKLNPFLWFCFDKIFICSLLTQLITSKSVLLWSTITSFSCPRIISWLVCTFRSTWGKSSLLRFEFLGVTLKTAQGLKYWTFTYQEPELETTILYSFPKLFIFSLLEHHLNNIQRTCFWFENWRIILCHAWFRW